jgi:hypothetical protein
MNNIINLLSMNTNTNTNTNKNKISLKQKQKLIIFFISIFLFNFLIPILSTSKTNKINNRKTNTFEIFTVTWTPTSLQAIDIGIGGDGDCIAVGLDGKPYLYNFIGNTWSVIDGDYEMINIVRADIDDEGTIFLIGTAGNIYYLSCYNSWHQLNGCGKDIGIGRGSDIWKIGCDSKGNFSDDYGIWKLFCKNKPQCGFNNTRKCMRFRHSKYTNNPNGDKRECYWTKIEGAGKRIDVHPNGNPYINTSSGKIFKYDNESFNFKEITGVQARDITLSNNGLLYAVGLNDNRIYRVLNEDTGDWQILSGCAKEISSGPYSQPWIVSCDGKILTTSKLLFN